jgi:hypothetical protein
VLGGLAAVARELPEIRALRRSLAVDAARFHEIAGAGGAIV